MVAQKPSRYESCAAQLHTGVPTIFYMYNKQRRDQLVVK